MKRDAREGRKGREEGRKERQCIFTISDTSITNDIL
jgi:hypothetical protein